LAGEGGVKTPSLREVEGNIGAKDLGGERENFGLQDGDNVPHLSTTTKRRGGGERWPRDL